VNILASGSGPKSWRLVQLWEDSGRPARVVVAAVGPATCSLNGFRWIARNGEACAAGAITLSMREGRLYGVPAGIVLDASAYALSPSLESVAQIVRGASITTYGVDWWTAQPFSKQGFWCRRKVWTDALQLMRHESGAGSTEAVAVIQGEEIPKRVVRNSEFGLTEFGAWDWIVPGAEEELDLTHATLSATGRWSIITGEPTVRTGPPRTTVPTVPEIPAAELNLVCNILTYPQWEIVRATAVRIADQRANGFSFGQGLVIAQGEPARILAEAAARAMERISTILLTEGVGQLIAAGGRVQCTEYYRDLILSFVNAKGSGSSSGTATQPAYIQGARGRDGVNGRDGADGADGAVGAAGTNGTDGTNGTNGTNGTDGSNGMNGTNGVGVPAGGATGQILAKASGTDYDTVWVDP
jgi:hypothetical protein